MFMFICTTFYISELCRCEERIYFLKRKYLCLYAYSSALVITKNNNENSKTMSNYIVSTTEKGEERKGKGEEEMQRINDTETNELNNIHDLPNFLRFIFKFSTDRWRNINAFILAPMTHAAFMPVSIQITSSLPLGILLAAFWSVTNALAFKSIPDFSKGVLLDIILKDEKKTKKISKEGQSIIIGTTIFMIFVMYPLMLYFFVVPFANTDNFGENTAVITYTLFVVGCVGQLMGNVIGAQQSLFPQVSTAHEEKIKSYLHHVRRIILNENFDQEDGLTIIKKLSKEQQKVEKWINGINKSTTSFNVVCLTVILLNELLGLMFIAGGVGIGTTLFFSALVFLFTVYIIQLLYAFAKPNMIWEQQKIALLNDAQVILNLKFPRESFKEWLSLHNFNATKVFGTKVTFEKMKQAAGLFTSIVGIVLYVLLREELRGML